MHRNDAIGHALAATAGLLAGLAHAADAGPLLGPVTSLWLENDLVVRTDQHYTHGTRIGHVFGERSLGETNRRGAGLAAWLPSLGNHAVAWRPAVSITQNIYTPADISRADPIPNDRPYAGRLFVTGSILKRGVTGGGTAVLDTWSFSAGVVGPGSLAEQSQNYVHRFRALPLAMGWDNQLRNEPDLGLRYGRVLRYSAPVKGHVTGEFLPHAGVVGGTAQSFVSVGAQWRVGLHLPADFGWRSIDDIIPGSGGRTDCASARRGCYGFLGVDGRAFGHNRLVEGNWFHDGHSMPLQRFVGEVKFGIVYSGQRWDVAYTHQVRTPEFEGQGDVDSFGSLSVAWKW